MIYQTIKDKFEKGEKQLALLIDPDKFPAENKLKLINILKTVGPDLLLIGGSLISKDTFTFIDDLKEWVKLPVILYPGSYIQVAPNADAILFLSLISGRNPEFLISHHVSAAPLLKKHAIEAISTGYMLIDGGSTTSVQYISQTQAIPANKTDIAIATALAGQYLGMQLIYMDAGSGALNPISQEMINTVKHEINIPLMIGGGLNTVEKVRNACQAGADIVVIGNAFEKDLHLLEDFIHVVKSKTF